MADGLNFKKAMKRMIEIYVNGDWDTSLETTKSVIVYNKGTVYLINEDMYDIFIDDLEINGYDCYLCPQLFNHPNWNGIIKFNS